MKVKASVLNFLQIVVSWTQSEFLDHWADAVVYGTPIEMRLEMGIKPQTTGDVFDLMDSYVTAAVLGSAVELGLFWMLADGPKSAGKIAQILHIPLNRCRYWLQLLQSTGLLEVGEDGYALSTIARTTILDSHSQETWAFLAQESREHYPAVQNLTTHIREPGSSWAAQGLTPPNYITQMTEDPKRAEQFTRMLYELHQSFADEIAASLDLSHAKQLLDLGGGSGVVSLALLRRYPDLTSVIVDIPNVCVAGREIARENGMEHRLTYLEANFLRDDLPSGFDVVLQCDVGEHDPAYLRKLWSSLEPGGHLVVVEQFESEDGVVPRQYKYWAFLGSMSNPDFSVRTLSDLTAGLKRAGFQVVSARPLIPESEIHWNEDWTLIEARKE